MKRTLTTLFLLVLAACGSDSGDANTPRPSGTLQFLETSFGASEGTVVNILVTRTGGSSGVASVDYAASGGTAVAGVDYPVTNGTLTYADGVSGQQTISIPMTDDNTVENTETLTVTLSNVSGATLGTNASFTVNIIDNDRALLPITADNARAITADVLGTITSTVEFINILDIIGLPVMASATPALAPAQSAVVMGVSTNVVACDTGEASVTWDDADNNLVISTGDTFDVEFEDCIVADIETHYNGAVSLTNLVVTGDPFNQIAPWSLVLTIDFNLGVINSGGLAGGINGGLDLDLSSEDNVVVDLSIATTFLSAAVPRTDFSVETETLSDYALDETLDLNALTQVASTSGTFASTWLEGVVAFESLQDFVIMADDNPSAGQLLISASSSSVLVTVLDNVNVQLEIDIDLDGTIDQTIVVTWAELDFDLGT